MTNTNSTPAVGDIVKSYDFVGNTECYFVGEVIALLDYGFKAKTIKHVFSGKAKNIVAGRNDYFTAPFVGNSFMDEFAGDFQRVQVVG